MAACYLSESIAGLLVVEGEAPPPVRVRFEQEAHDNPIEERLGCAQEVAMSAPEVPEDRQEVELEPPIVRSLIDLEALLWALALVRCLPAAVGVAELLASLRRLAAIGPSQWAQVRWSGRRVTNVRGGEVVVVWVWGFMIWSFGVGSWGRSGVLKSVLENVHPGGLPQMTILGSIWALEIRVMRRRFP